MNEIIKSERNILDICRACLKDDNNLQVASEKMSNTYSNFISQTYNGEVILLCVYCKYLIAKTEMFKRQCHEANVLINSIDKNSTSVRMCYDLKSQKPQITEITSQHTEFNVKEEDHCDDTFCDDGFDDDLPLAMLKQEDGDLKVEKIEIETKPTLSLNTLEAETSQHYYEKPTLSHSNDRNLPLQECSKKKRKKRKRKNKQPDEPPLCTKKRNQNPKTGFTSRMVQETDEYVVIKLTKEQVLEEMRRKEVAAKYLKAPYKCALCVKGFNFVDVLDNHMKKHSLANGSLKCDICSQYCPTPVSMRGHLKSHTTRYKCKVCSEVRLSRQHLMEHHASMHTGRVMQYNCNECSFVTTKRTVMQRHWRSHAKGPTHSCHQCGRLYRSIESLRTHILRHEKVKRYACERCDKSFIYPSLLAAHEQTHSASADWYCVECDVRFKSKDNLRTHFRKSLAHRDPSILKYPCEWCEKRCMSNAALLAHRASAHGAEKTHLCRLCDKAYSSGDGLRSHVRRVHSNAQPPKRHVCDTCNDSFATRASVVRHSRVHTGERPYGCAVCGARFAQSSTLRTHARLLHDKRRRPARGGNLEPAATSQPVKTAEM